MTELRIVWQEERHEGGQQTQNAVWVLERDGQPIRYAETKGDLEGWTQDFILSPAVERPARLVIEKQDGTTESDVTYELEAQ